MIEDLLKYNCSTLFLLYPLGLSVQGLSGTGFRNCYLRDSERPEYNSLNIVLLLFKPRDSTRFQCLVDTEKSRTPLFIDEYDYEGGYTVMVYEFPPDLASDYALFKEGKYSRLSKEFQKTVPVFITTSTTPATKSWFVEKGNSHPYTLAWMVINRHPLWEQYVKHDLNVPHLGEEFYEVPDMKKETLFIQKLAEV